MLDKLFQTGRDDQRRKLMFSLAYTVKTTNTLVDVSHELMIFALHLSRPLHVPGAWSTSLVSGRPVVFRSFDTSRSFFLPFLLFAVFWRLFRPAAPAPAV